MSLFNLAQTSKLRTLTIFSKPKCVWPHPERSIGTWYRKMGKFDCWEAKGLARDTFAKLAEEIKDYLNRCSDPFTHTVTWSVYMIGKTRETATPTIMFCCEETSPRKAVRKIVSESGILSKYPGITTGDCAQPPDFDQLIQLAGQESWKCNLPDTATYHDNVILNPPSKNILGTQIYIKNGDDDTSSFRRATAGGILRLGNRYFVLTAAHAFMKSDEPPAQGGQTGSDFEFDIDGMSDCDDNDASLTEAIGAECKQLQCSDSDIMSTSLNRSLNCASPPSSFCRSIIERCLPSSAARTPVSTPNLTDPEQPGWPNETFSVVGDLAVSSMNGLNTGLNYALVEIKEAHSQSYNEITLTGEHGATHLYPERIAGPRPIDTNVVAVTGSGGLLNGVLLGRPSFLRLPCSQRFQEVWTVRLAGHLSKGDCGSWVVDAENGDVYRHIVAGSPESGVAYIVPAYHVYEDLKKCFSSDLKLSTRASRPDNEDAEPKSDLFYSRSLQKTYRRCLKLSQTLELKRIDRFERFLQWRVIMLAGCGFFVDSYNIFAMNMVIPMIHIVYQNTMPRGNYSTINVAINVATLIGIILGQIIFGVSADLWGRSKVYGLQLVFVIAGCLGMATLTGINGVTPLLTLLMFWRFILGIGIGGDYPLSAVITSEFAPTRRRSRMLATLFICQALGPLAAQLVALTAISIAHQGSVLGDAFDKCGAECLRRVDITWRCIVFAGAIPAALAFCCRLTIPESPRYVLDVQNERSTVRTDSFYGNTETSTNIHFVNKVHHPGREAEARVSIPKSRPDDYIYQLNSFKQRITGYSWLKSNFRVLLGTSLTWFLLDFAFYGLGLNSTRITSQVWSSNVRTGTSVYTALTRNASQNIVILSLSAVVGGLISVGTIDRLGGRKIQMIGFAGLTSLFLMLGLSRLLVTHNQTAFIVLYIICQVFFNFGPNTTTFIIPAEIFPTRYRCTAHGVSAASGKIGSVLAQYFINYVKYAGTEYGSSEWLGYTLLVFSALMLVGFVLTIYWIPETRKKDGAPITLEELAKERDFMRSLE